MNLNEKCLLKFLTNPIEVFNIEKELEYKIPKIDEFNFFNFDKKVLTK